VARYLLDTNTCIAVMRNHPTAVRRLAAVAPGDCAVSTITGFELYTGVEKCAHPARERTKVDLLLRRFWSFLLVLVTANTKEFSRVPGLTLENWQI
jgi:predicted nucleic acid-binding protein